MAMFFDKSSARDITLNSSLPPNLLHHWPAELSRSNHPPTPQHCYAVWQLKNLAELMADEDNRLLPAPRARA